MLTLIMSIMSWDGHGEGGGGVVIYRDVIREIFFLLSDCSVALSNRNTLQTISVVTYTIFNVLVATFLKVKRKKKKSKKKWVGLLFYTKF